MTTRVTTLLAALAIAAFAVGCGGEDEDASSAAAAGSASSLTKAEFISKANAICARRKRKLLRDLSDYSLAYREQHPNRRASANAFPGGLRTVGIPGLQAQADELRKLGLPADDEGGAEAYLDAFQEAIDSARDRPRTDGAQFLRDFEESRDLARDYGIGACAFG